MYQGRLAILNGGGILIHAPDLEQMVQRSSADGRLPFTTEIVVAVPHGALQFRGGGTPPDEDGSADLQYVWAAARSIGEHMTDDEVVVDRSTVPVGTADRVLAAVQEVLAERVDADIERVPHGLPLRILLPRETRTASSTSHEPSQLPPALRLSLSPGCQDAGLQRRRYGQIACPILHRLCGLPSAGSGQAVASVRCPVGSAAGRTLISMS